MRLAALAASAAAVAALASCRSAPARSAPSGDPDAAGAPIRYEVDAVRYGRLLRFPAAGLVAGADSARRIDIALMVWLARAPGRVVLVDAGFYRDKFTARWGPADYERPSLALARAGVRPEDVTDIVVSHVHWDHLDGADLFPRARLWIQRAEYDGHVDETGRARNGAIDAEDAAMLHRLRRAGRVRLVSGDSVEIIPGITLFTGGRHTIASQYAMVRTAAGPVVIASDNAYLYENLEQRRPIAQTLDSVANLAAQARMLRLAGDVSRVVPGHDPGVFDRYPQPGNGVARIAPTAQGGARPPGPELYGAGLFSTGAWDFFMAWSPDGREVLFCRASDDFAAFDVYETRLGADGRWSAPRRPRFAERWSNADPHVSPDGRTVFFISNRPLPTDTGAAASAARRSYDVWYATRDADGAWGDARWLEGPVNDPRVTEWSPAVAANGNLYVGTVRRGGKGGNDLWVSRLANGAYGQLENLGDSVNTAAGEIEPWIAPDESYIVFSGVARADSVGGYDLYVAHRKDGVWQRARPLGNGINSAALDFNPSVTPDGRWLYFSSTRAYDGPLGPRLDWPRDEASVRGIGNGRTGDIYRVPVGELGVAPP